MEKNEQFSDAPIENIKMENEFFKIKLQVEHGDMLDLFDFWFAFKLFINLVLTHLHLGHLAQIVCCDLLSNFLLT